MQSVQAILNGMGQQGGSATAVASALVNKNDVSAHAATNTSDDGSNSDITANDFLTLLVSELKNQDPTQPTDPNAYISQLVDVNSLQQLIQINQGINGTGTPTPAP